MCIRKILPRNDWCQRISVQSGDLSRKLDLKKLTSPKTFHEALATSTTSLYHGAIGTCSQQIQIQHWFICIKNLGRSKRVLHQLWKPCAQRQAHTTSFRLSWCHDAKGCTSTRAALSQRRSPFRNLSRLKSPEKNASVHAIAIAMAAMFHAMSPNDCTARRCAARPRLHGTTLGTNYPQCFYTCTNGCCIVLFASMKCLCPYHFRQLWVWLRHHFEPENYKPILHQKA